MIFRLFFNQNSIRYTLNAKNCHYSLTHAVAPLSGNYGHETTARTTIRFTVNIQSLSRFFKFSLIRHTVFLHAAVVFVQFYWKWIQPSFLEHGLHVFNGFEDQHALTGRKRVTNRKEIHVRRLTGTEKSCNYSE